MKHIKLPLLMISFTLLVGCSQITKDILWAKFYYDFVFPFLIIVIISATPFIISIIKGLTVKDIPYIAAYSVIAYCLYVIASAVI